MAAPADSLEAASSSEASNVPPAHPFRLAKLPPPPLYTTSTSRPFSRSALKRQSVMALPSIQHLQHGFAKLGLKEAKKGGVEGSRRRSGGTGEDKENEGRLGGLAGTAEEEEDGEEGFEGVLGPEPPKPEVDLRMPWEKEGLEASFRGAQELRREAEEALDVVSERWGLTLPSSALSAVANVSIDQPHELREASTVSTVSSASTSSQTDNTDSAPLSPLTSASSTSDSPVPLVLTLLTLTTGAIRTTQQFVLSLPSTSTSSASITASPDPPQISTASRPRTSLASPFATAASMSRSSSSGSNQGNPAVVEADERATLLADLQKKSLEVLGMLREMEGRYRLPVPGRLLVDEGEGMVASALERDAPALPHPDAGAELEKEEELIYRSDITLASLTAEQDVVREWMGAVKRVLERTAQTEGGRRKSGAGGGGAQEDVPAWARKDGWENSLARAHTMIIAHLSPEQTSALPDPASDRTGFLDALSDGYLLCLAYNAALRLSSPHPFGFITSSSIHPFPPTSSSSVEMSRTTSSASDGGAGGEKIGLTFRRAENLRLWAGALKHRYNLAFAGPPPFDPKVVAARKEEGWRDGLERAIGEWAEVVAKEVRGEEADTGETDVGHSAETS